MDAVEELRDSLVAIETVEALLSGHKPAPRQLAMLLRVINASFAQSLARAERAVRGEA